jgi:uncharacterized protein (TIGR00730 family)
LAQRISDRTRLDPAGALSIVAIDFAGACRWMRILKTIAVYCGSMPGSRPVYTEMARAFGGELARRGIRLVYGGGARGLMGSLADGALEHGGEITGVIPTKLMEMELAHHGVSDMRVVATMHERKQLMSALADAFVVLPGGFGTMDELFDNLVATQLGYHHKPCGVLDTEGLYTPLAHLRETMIDHGFVPPHQRHLMTFHRDPHELLDALANWTPPRVGKFDQPEQ